MNFTDLKCKSSTHKMVFAAIMGGLAVVLNFFEIPYPVVPFLRFDISEAIVIIVVMLVGLRYGLMVSIIKALVFFLMGSNGNDPIGTGVLLFSSCLLAIVFYLFSRKLSLIPALIGSGIIFALALTAVAYYVSVPLYSGVAFEQMSQSADYLPSIITVYLPFNIIKMIIVSVVVLIMNRILFKNSKC